MSNPTERLKNKTTLVAEASRGIGRVINISSGTSLSDFPEKWFMQWPRPHQRQPVRSLSRSTTCQDQIV